jgi:hypothetical protein
LLKTAKLLPDNANNGGRKRKQKPWLDLQCIRGNRAEVRRERKKRDILSPVNVLSLKPIYHKILYKAILFFQKINLFLAK